MKLPIFLLNDTNGGVSAYHDRASLDAAVISVEESPHLSAWGSDGERLVLTVAPDGWQISPDAPPVFDTELLRDLLRERLVQWDGLVPSQAHRDRIIDRAALHFKVRKPLSRWRRFANSFTFNWFGPT